MTGRGWRRRTLYRDKPREVAHSAVSAHVAALCSIYALRHGELGVDHLVVHLHGRGRGIGPWEDTLLDLVTGEVLVISSEDPEWMARELDVDELPPAWLKVWPRRNGRLVTPGLNDGPTGGGPGENWFRRHAGNVTIGAEQMSLLT